MHTITHDPRDSATPSQLRLADERLERMARIDGRAFVPSNEPAIPLPTVVAAPLRATTPSGLLVGSALHPRSTLANLIPYRGASLAQAAARLLSDPRDAGLTVNPLFVHGKTGLGKTHLLQAIAHEFVAAGISVAHYDADALSGLYGLGISERAAECDVLIVDNIDFVVGRLNKMHISALLGRFAVLEKPSIISASIRPRELEGFEDRTISRLTGGLTVEIRTPDREARLAFILQRMQMLRGKGWNFELTEAVTGFIADHLARNFRDIEAALNRLLALQRSGEEITTDIAASTIFDLTNSEERRGPKIEDIQRACCKHWNVTRNDILSQRRTANVVRPRQVAMYLAKTLTLRSLPEIGRRFGGRDHTTVLHAVRKIGNLVAVDTSLAAEVAAITALFQPQPEAS